MFPPNTGQLRFKLDENLPGAAAAVLSAAGHDVSTVLLQSMAGAPDPQIADVCSREGRILVTLDAGFGDIREYPPGSHPGIIVLQPRSPSIRATTELFERLANFLESGELVAGCLWKLSPSRLRIRGPH